MRSRRRGHRVRPAACPRGGPSTTPATSRSSSSSACAGGSCGAWPGARGCRWPSRGCSCPSRGSGCARRASRSGARDRWSCSGGRAGGRSTTGRGPVRGGTWGRGGASAGSWARPPTGASGTRWGPSAAGDEATRMLAGASTYAMLGLMELGIYTFAEITPGGDAGQRLREVVEEAEVAEQVGLDVFGVGEHHRADFAVSTPAVVLAAVAARTSGIRLTSAVSVLSSADPVRVFQDFATLDLLSGGRAEVMAGRGSFIESFPLFGYDLDDYDELFAEHLDLLLALRRSERV